MWWMIRPNSTKRIAWDLLSAICIFYDVIMNPLQFLALPPSGFLDSTTWIARIFWTSDMPLNCITGFLKADGMVEMRPRVVAWHYSKTWLVLDVIVVGGDWCEFIIEAITNYSSHG